MWDLVSQPKGSTQIGGFENRVLRKIYVFKTEVTGGWKKLYKEEFHNLYSSPNTIRVIIRIMRQADYVACMGEMRHAHNLVGKWKEKRPHGTLRHNWEDNVKINFWGTYT